MLDDLLLILLALALVTANGFFVAAEFAMIKARPYRLDELAQTRRLARTARWLQRRMDGTLAACQLGITMASLALGWVGEPAFARLLRPVFGWLSVESEAAIHGISFAVAFSTITALHLVAGEQVPKIFAIRKPEVMAMWCAPAMRTFYAFAYPFLWLLSSATNGLLRAFGVQGSTGHEEAHTEDEIRALMVRARDAGELTREEHKLLHAVFDFDDLLCRRIMLPRPEVVYFDVNQPISECLAIVARTEHTRYPLCDGSLDDVLGVVHIKDLIGAGERAIDLRSVARPPHRVPETMPISKLLRHFQASRQHLAFVVDEYGNTIGIVTLENVLEQIVGPVEDEFDLELAPIVADGGSDFLVLGGTSIEQVNRHVGLELSEAGADTLSGLLVVELGRLPRAGDKVALAGATAEVLEASSGRAQKVRLRVEES